MMTSFRTQVNPALSPIKINFESPILMIGSCFTENIGQQLLQTKFPVLINPFGILFNPESIAQSIECLLNYDRFTADNLILHKGIYSSFSHHGRFSNTNESVCLEQINSELMYARQWLQKTRFIIITFGTSWVYRYKPTGKVVANCHKIDGKKFERTKLSVDEIRTRYEGIISTINLLYPHIQFLFTVSPVRHLRDGATENQLSKATLLLAVEQLIKTFRNVHYFPAYEIMMDDLRDYRFYADDMVHPSPLAISYIHNLFQNAWMDDKTRQVMSEIDKIRQAKQHKPIQPDSDEFKKFVSHQLEIIKSISNKYPQIDFDEERAYFANYLHKG